MILDPLVMIQRYMDVWKLLWSMATVWATAVLRTVNRSKFNSLVRSPLYSVEQKYWRDANITSA